MIARRVNDRRTWEWEMYQAVYNYLTAGLKEKTPDKLMLCEEAAFIKLRLDMSKAGFFNKQGGLADEHYLAWTNSLSRLFDRLGLRWTEDAPNLQDYLKRRALEEEAQRPEPTQQTVSAGGTTPQDPAAERQEPQS
jgi:hypothetical protein